METTSQILHREIMQNTDAKLTGSITAAGSSALKPLVDDAADLFNEKHPDVNITIDAGGSGEGLKTGCRGYS